MRLSALGEQSLRLETTGPGLEVATEHFGPIEMLAASLMLCTASVVATYGDTARLELAGFAVDLAWEYADDPYRVGAYVLTLRLPPAVSPVRHRALIRAAETCTVHNTLIHPPRIETQIAAYDGAPADEART